MSKFRSAAIVLTVLSLLAASCGTEDPIVPTDDQEKEETDKLPENPKIKAAVEQMAEEASSISQNLSGIEVWQDGFSSSGAWLRDSEKGTRHQMWSVTKTFTGVAVGIAVSEGKLSLSDNVAAMFPEEVALAEKSELSDGSMMTEEQKSNLKALTVKDLLTMADGHKSDPTTVYAKKYSASLLLNFGRYISGGNINASLILDDRNTTIADLFFHHPFKAVPGTDFQYDSFASCLLSEIVQEKTGETTADFLYSRLFKPLGLDKPVWDGIQGASAGGWGLHLTTGEMTAFGRLLLQGGVYDGAQIIPSDYLKSAVSGQVEADSNYKKDYYTDSYGYQIWTRKDGTMYQCAGLFGQYIIVLPEKKAVIALTSDFKLSYSGLASLISDPESLQNEKVLDLAWKYVIPSL